jgi:Cu2+-exporting ATPase
MSCCAPGAEDGLRPQSGAAPSEDEIRLASRAVEDGVLQTDLSIPSAHCGACIAAIEGALSRLDGVTSARLNLSTRRAAVKWKKDGPVPPLLRALSEAGYEATLFTHEEADADPEMGRLIRATAVAGFAAANIMLLSVSVWAGADGETRNAFHLVSALLALPAVTYSGRLFFLSAWAALKSRRTNMDVPISIGILLALALSLYDTLRDGPHAYFDAVTTLIFFLLVGRTLDHLMRRRARTAVLGLARMMPHGATVIARDGTRAYRPQAEIEPGERVLVTAGDRIPLDGTVVSGAADLDAALVTGEATPVAAQKGDAVLSGMLNLNGSLEIKVTRRATESFIAEMMRMMEAAEHGRARYRRIADRAAALYSPFVHSLAAAAFLGWMWASGDWHRSLTLAISVLIITCPCALGLAVPMVQVVAARRLFQRGIALKDGSALERLAEADVVVFDKTGTLTLGDLRVAECGVLPGKDLDAVAALAGLSRHPASRAISAFAGTRGRLEIEEFREVPGCGIEGRIGGSLYRLGRADWALGSRPAAPDTNEIRGTAASRDGASAGYFEFSDVPRPQAGEAIEAVRDLGLAIEMLSGDCREAAARVASLLGIEKLRAGLLPRDKLARLEELAREGGKPLMVGDGLNDAPALSAAHVSMAPASAADVGRAAADLVFFGSGLMAVPEALRIAATARRLVRQNLALAIAYNLFVIPVALAGYVTPLMAAVAMSMSSILVIANALRFPAAKERTAADRKPETASFRAAEAAR